MNPTIGKGGGVREREKEEEKEKEKEKGKKKKTKNKKKPGKLIDCLSVCKWRKEKRSMNQQQIRHLSMIVQIKRLRNTQKPWLCSSLV